MIKINKIINIFHLISTRKFYNLVLKKLRKLRIGLNYIKKL